MEKYLRHEPTIKLGKKPRLPSGNRRSSSFDVFSPNKLNTVDILAIKEEIEIKREMSDQVQPRLLPNPGSVAEPINVSAASF